MQGALVRGTYSLYVQAYRAFPGHLCNEVEERLPIKKSYAMGCTCRMGLYGNISLHLRHENDVTNGRPSKHTPQAGVALQRRHLKEKLRKAEKQIGCWKGQSIHRPGGPCTPGQ